MGHVGVMVPEGHVIQIHPPGAIGAPPGAMGAPPPAPGMIPNPPAEGALAAMNSALPPPVAPSSAGPAPAPKPKPKHKKKKKKKKAAPTEKESPAEDVAEGAEEPDEQA